MTVEQLEQGKKLVEEMKQLENFRKAFHEPCIKTIIAYKTDVKEPKVSLGFDTSSELYELIDGYLWRRLKEIKREFNEI